MNDKPISSLVHLWNKYLLCVYSVTGNEKNRYGSVSEGAYSLRGLTDIKLMDTSVSWWGVSLMREPPVLILPRLRSRDRGYVVNLSHQGSSSPGESSTPIKLGLRARNLCDCKPLRFGRLFVTAASPRLS